MQDNERAKDVPERVHFKCSCGMDWHQVTRHYEVIRCRCNRAVWSLRPKRGGPLVGYQHPGYQPGVVIEMVG